MKQIIQKLAFMCALASIGGLAHGYNRIVVNQTPFNATVTLHKVACQDETRDVPAFGRVQFNKDACLVRTVSGSVKYVNPAFIDAETGQPLSQDIDCTDNWYSKGGGWGGLDFAVTMKRAHAKAIPTFSIKEINL